MLLFMGYKVFSCLKHSLDHYCYFKTLWSFGSYFIYFELAMGLGGYKKSIIYSNNDWRVTQCKIKMSIKIE